MNTGIVALGLFVLIWGVIWLGNDMGFWNIVFPFWPVLVILAGVVILLHAIKKSVENP